MSFWNDVLCSEECNKAAEKLHYPEWTKHVQWLRKLILACRTKCPAGLQRTAGHFEPLSDIFPSWGLANISGHSCCPYRTFYVYWTLLDEMSGMVRALCRTSAEVCRTCPACPAYFATTACIELTSVSRLPKLAPFGQFLSDFHNLFFCFVGIFKLHPFIVKAKQKTN